MESKTTLGVGVRPLQGGGGIFKSAAVAVLRMERRLMTTGEITKVALEKALINCQGRTPEATMASALYTDVKRKLDSSVFTRPQEGLFGLKEWEDEGFVPEPVLMAGLPAEVLSQPPAGSKRLRGASTRVIKKPERFVVEDFEEYDELTARSTPSPLLPLETHQGAAVSPKQLGPLPGQELTEGLNTLLGHESAGFHAGMQLEQAMGDLDGQRTRSNGHGNVEFALDFRPPVSSVPPLLDAARKRPCLEVEVPTQAADPLSGDLQFLFATPGAMPLSATLDALGQPSSLPLLLSPLTSPLPSPGLHAHHLPPAHRSPTAALRPMRHSFSTAGSESNEPPQSRGDDPAAASSCLDTPNFMQLPLPEGDLSWSPLGLPSHSRPADLPKGVLADLHQAERQASASWLQDVGSTVTQSGPDEAAHGFPTLPAIADGAGPSCLQASQNLSRLEHAPGNDAQRLAAMEEEVRMQEAALGDTHPLVGKHWLALSRAYQTADAAAYADKAEFALVRAWKICSACFSKSHSRPTCDPPFDYLLGHIRSLSKA